MTPTTCETVLIGASYVRTDRLAEYFARLGFTHEDVRVLREVSDRPEHEYGGRLVPEWDTLVAIADRIAALLPLSQKQETER